MPRVKQSRPIKKISTIVYRGPKRIGRARPVRRRRGSRNYGIGGPKMIYLKSRCVVVVPLAPEYNVGTSFIRTRFTVPWARPFTSAAPANAIAVIGTSDVMFKQKSVFDSARFNAVAPNWKQYAVTGMRIEYFPQPYIGVSQAISQPLVTKISVNGGLNKLGDNGIKVPTQDLITDAGYRQIATNRKFTKYINFKPLSRAQHVDWAETDSLPLTYEVGTLAAGWTMFDIALNKFVDPLNFEHQDWGNFKLTWYVTFRSQA